MATQSDIEQLYDWVHTFHTLRVGEFPDFSCAYFDGDYSKTLSEAQEDKHRWVLEGIRFRSTDVILDVGSGWGPMLDAIKRRGGKGLGLTLSRNQQRYCAERGLKTLLQDWKTVHPATLGIFNGIVSIGAFEHFCSIVDYLQMAQDRIYREFFAFCAQALPAGGRLFLQTMTWGRDVPDPTRLSLTAPEGSPERILARLIRFYPGSWLPVSKEQIIAAADRDFRFLNSSNGRLDYIETLSRWGQSNLSLIVPSRLPKAFWAAANLVPRFVKDPNFRTQIASLRHNDQQVCFIKEIMSHERMFFEKR
jgi:cyclopropane-fatty-acyl-phospholipid synthase